MRPRIYRRLLLILGLTAGLTRLTAQSTVFIVRHADRGPEEPDAHLTALGLRRADELARLLADANIRQVYTTEFTRTRQTAAPTAKLAKVDPVVVRQDDVDGLVVKIRAVLREGESTLVVGHRSTVPKIARALGGSEIKPLASDEFSRVIVLTIFPDGRTSVVTLRYGLKPQPPIVTPPAWRHGCGRCWRHSAHGRDVEGLTRRRSP